MSYDVIVIGLGVMGVSACRALAKRELRVLGLEQFELCHDRGSSHGRSRVIRKAYFEDPRYVPLLHATYDLWRELETASAETIIHYAGCLNLGPAYHECVQGARQSAEEHGLSYEALSAADVRARWPVLAPNESDIGIYETDAGFVVPERCVRLLADDAIRAGATMHEREPVRGWTAANASATVTTDAATYECKHVVITRGAWLSDEAIARQGKIPLTVERQVQLWFRPPRIERFGIGGVPSFVHFVGDRAYYGIPASSEGLFKTARHHGGEATHPDRIRRVVTDADVADVRDFLKKHIPDADGEPVASEVCMYTNTPDDHFVIDRHPAHENVVIAGGFSGHGFKFGPVVGEIVADLITNNRTNHAIELFSLGRFAR